jgi:hypothetical protein
MALDATGAKLPGNLLIDQSTQVDSRTAGQHWLRVLEQTRAEALGKTRSVTSRSAGPPAGVSTTGQAPESSVNLRAATHTQAAGPSAQTHMATQASASAARPAAPAFGSARSAGAGFGASASGAGLAQRLETFFSELLSAGRSYPRSASATWEAINIYMEAGEEGVRLWLRDSDLSPEEARKILQRVGRQLAEAGLRLHQFYVNGEPVFGGEAPQEGS